MVVAEVRDTETSGFETQARRRFVNEPSICINDRC